MKTTRLMGSAVFLIGFLLTGCSGSGSAVAAVTPTGIDVQALQTAAVATIFANITQTADAQPTLTPTQTFTPVPLVPTETQTPTPSGNATQSLCDNSAFISDASVIDGTQMTAGQEFVKTWKVKNTGACLWKVGYKLIFAYGEKMGGVPVALTAEVSPGGEAEISINLKAPDKSGNYGGYWRLANNNNVPFGQILTVIIVIP
ncbi:MAG: NBR1-Ig-like domain-containing protein [Chloroflexota bacterium]